MVRGIALNARKGEGRGQITIRAAAKGERGGNAVCGGGGRGKGTNLLQETLINFCIIQAA